MDAERDPLEELRGDEEALEREVLAARREAAAIVERAHREAQAIAAEALRDGEREVGRLRAAAAEESARAAAEARAAARARTDELEQRASRNLDRAVAHAIETAVGDPVIGT